MEKILNYAYDGDFYISKAKNIKYGVADGYIYDLVSTYIIDPCIVVTDNVSLYSTIDNNKEKINQQVERSIEILKQYSVSKYKEYNNTVWQYWEKKNDKEPPGYITYCMNRVNSQANKDNLNYILITPDNMYKYIPDKDIPKNFYEVKEIAHRADFIRIYVLLHYGGMWVDSDSFIKGSLVQLFNDLHRNEMVYWDRKGEKEPI
jgi:mannosyltransferase OCH1-like enzyme